MSVVVDFVTVFVNYLQVSSQAGSFAAQNYLPVGVPCYPCQPPVRGRMPLPVREVMPYPVRESIPYPMRAGMPHPMREGMPYPVRESIPYPVRESIPHPSHALISPLPMPVNIPQCPPPFDCAQQRFRPAPCEPVFRPQPSPDQHMQFDAASFPQPPLLFPSRPHMIPPPFELSRPSHPGDGGAFCAFPSVRQTFLPPPYPQPQHLESPQTSEPNAPVVSVGVERVFVPSSAESVSNNQAPAVNQTLQRSAASEHVPVPRQPELPYSGNNVDITPRKSSESKYDSDNSRSSADVSRSDERRSDSRWHQRKSSWTPLHSHRSQRSRDPGRDSSSHRDSDKYRDSTLDKR